MTADPYAPVAEDGGFHSDNESGGAAAGAALMGGVVGAIPGLNIFAPGLAETFGQAGEADARGQMVRNANAIKLPRYDPRSYETQQYAGDFRPDMYSTPEAAQYQTISEDPRIREMQIKALQNMQGYADGAADSQQSLDRQQSLNDASQFAKQRQGAIASQAARRGQLGNGLDYVMQQQAAQQGANQAQTGMLNANAQAALQRLQGMQGSLQGASQVRGQDYNAANSNADIINKFNMYNTQNRNDANQANTGMHNAAELRNLNARQGNQNTNTGIMNSGINRNDANANGYFDATMQKLNALNSAIGGQANQAAQAGTKANAAGKQGFDNFKDLMTMGGSSMMGGG